MPEPTPTIDNELAELLEAVANRELSPEQNRRLTQRLESDPQARRVYIESAAFDAMLTHEFPSTDPQVASSALELPESDPEDLTAISNRSRVKPQTNWLVISLLGLAASLLLALSILRPIGGPTPIAVLASSENAAWESTLPTTPGSELVPGLLRLRSGIAKVRFTSGAEVTLESPAQLEMISPMRGKLIDGAAVIDVPDEAIGFVMETPDGYAIDYGTKFAVHVDRDAQRSDFELIEGEIAVHASGSEKGVRLTQPQNAVSVFKDSVDVIDLEQPTIQVDGPGKFIRIGTQGRATSVLRNNKRKKFLNPEVLSVKTTENGKWDYRSFFAFDLSSVDASRIKTARLRLNMVPSQRGFSSRLPVLNRFGIYGLTNSAKSDWDVECKWEDAPAPEDGILLGTFDVLRSQQRGTFGIENQKLATFMRDHPNQSVTLILVRETSQVEGERPGLTHMFASDVHPESVGPLLELTVE